MSLIKELKPGTVINVAYLNQIHQKTSVNMIYVGLIENEYLILRFAHNNKAPDLHGLKAGTHLSIRSVVAKESLTAINFESSSLGTSKLREPLLLVDYPKSVQGQHLRKAPRMPVELMANVSVANKTTHLALISDFSLSGTKCEYISEEPKEGEDDTKSFAVDDQVSVEFIANDDLDLDFTIRDTIKNVVTKEKVTLGIEFLEEDAAAVKSAFAIMIMRVYGL